MSNKGMVVQNKEGRQLKTVKRRDMDRAKLAFVLSRVYDMCEPAKLDRSSKSYCEKTEKALMEIIDMVKGEMNFFTDPGKPHFVESLIKEYTESLESLFLEIRERNQIKGIEVDHQEWLQI